LAPLFFPDLCLPRFEVAHAHHLGPHKGGAVVADGEVDVELAELVGQDVHRGHNAQHLQVLLVREVACKKEYRQPVSSFGLEVCHLPEVK